MSVAYSDARIDFAGREATIQCRIRNLSRSTWKAGDSFAVGCQIVDRESGDYVADGEWVRLEHDVAPGAEADVEVRAELPADGRFRLIVSPFEAKSGWRYARGWPALVVDADMGNGNGSLVLARVTTAKRLSAASLPQRAARVFWYPARTVWSNWPLIRSMVRRDVLSRYRGSLGDVLWTVLSPLLLMATYFFVFGVVLQTRFGNDPSKSGFALYFLAGMLPWLATSEAVGRSALLILEHRNFVKKLVFPLEILPVNVVIAGLVTELFALGVFLVGLLLLRGGIPITVLWLPAVLIPQVLFAAGLCWFLAGLGAYLRDLGQIIGFLLTLWFFLTPICYPEWQLPASIAPILAKNPMYVLVSNYRAILLEARAPEWVAMSKLWIVGIAACVLGHAWFYRLRKSFADVI